MQFTALTLNTYRRPNRYSFKPADMNAPSDVILFEERWHRTPPGEGYGRHMMKAVTYTMVGWEIKEAGS